MNYPVACCGVVHFNDHYYLPLVIFFIMSRTKYFRSLLTLRMEASFTAAPSIRQPYFGPGGSTSFSWLYGPNQLAQLLPEYRNLQKNTLILFMFRLD